MILKFLLDELIIELFFEGIHVDAQTILIGFEGVLYTLISDELFQVENLGFESGENLLLQHRQA